MPICAAWSPGHALIVTGGTIARRSYNPDATRRFLASESLHAKTSRSLAFALSIVQGIDRLIDAGSVAPTLVHSDGEWWGRWDVVPTPEVTEWLTRAAAAMPEEFIPPGWAPRQTLEDMCVELTDVEVRRRTRDVSIGVSNDMVLSPMLNWLASVQSGEPAAGWPDATMRQLQARVHAWRTSSYVSPYSLVLRIDEDETRTDSAVIGSGVHPRERQPEWLLNLCLRPAKDPTHTLSVDDVAFQPDAPVNPEAFILAEYARAAHVFPVLMTYAAVPSTTQRRLTTAQAAWLVSEGAERLAREGIRVITPPTWVSAPLTLRLSAGDDTAGHDVPAPVTPHHSGTLGLRQMVNFSWRAAIGDVELTEDELREITAAKAPLVKLRGEWVQLDQGLAKKTLKFLEEHVTPPSGETAPAGSSLADLFSALGAGPSSAPVPVERINARGWLHALFATTTADHIEAITPPQGLLATLRPYQERGLSWLTFMSHHGLGVILADDMGLGKTIQLLSLLLEEREEARSGTSDAPVLPTLVICPMSVVGNWQREAERFTPSLRSYIHHGPGRSHGAQLAQNLVGIDLVITTYAVLSRDFADLSQIAWGRVTLDEAQHIKNAGTRQARAARSMPAAHRVALTGTPMENRLEELRSLFDFANPGLLGSAASFRKNFAEPIENDRDSTAIAKLTHLTRPFILRREKTDPEVIADLPEKIEMIARANLTKEQAGLYQAVVDDMVSRIGRSSGVERRGLILATLTKLKQICNHPAHYLGDGSPLRTKRGEHRSGKLALVEDVLDTVTGDGERALLFTQFREFGDLIQPWLTQRFGRPDQPIPFFHGQLSRKAREEMVENFQAPDGPPMLLLSLRAGGLGLNLTAASQVIHLDRWWNPAVEQQATDRAYRIGQTQRVQVRKLSCVGTVEERVDALMESKQELASLVIGRAENWLTELNTEELRNLIELSADAVGD